MGDLPEEIITNILTRLPVKSLLRFRCVSKPWCSLIDDSKFVKMHLNHAFQNNHFNLMVSDRDNDKFQSIDCDTCYTEAVEMDFPYKALASDRRLSLSSSCNGLLHVEIGHYDIIWNPCTREFKKVPREPVVMDKSKGSSNDMRCLLGFGYNPIIDDYKLVKMTQYCGDNGEYIGSDVMVYTLGTDSWRIVDDAPYYICCASQLPGNGNPHWLAMMRPDLFESRSIVCFDLVSEKFWEIGPPKCIGNIQSAGMLGECLCMLGSQEETQGDVWVMKDYGVKESWVKLFTIISSTVITSVQDLDILCHSKNGKILLRERFDGLILYDQKLKESRMLEIRGIPANLDDVLIYAGSLVSLKTSTYVGQETLNKQKRKQNNRPRVGR